MAATGAEAADRSLLEGDASGSYGATTGASAGESGAGAPAGAAAGAGAAAPPRLTPQQLLNEVVRNAGVFQKMIGDAVMGSLAPLLTEGFGTFVLVFTVGCAVAGPTPSPWAPVTIATVLTAMVYGTFNISGAQLNPAVTFALTLLGKKTWGKMLGNWFFQFMGAFTAAGTYRMVCAPHIAVVAPVPPFHPGYALGAEALFTAMLVFVVLNCACRPGKEPHPCFGLAIGFAFLSAGYACGHISGCALNPAVSVPLGLSSGKDAHWAFSWFGAELVGAALATGLFWLLRRSEHQAAADVAAAALAAESSGGATGPVEGDTGAAAPGTVEGPTTVMRCLAEVVGTFMLVVVVGFNIIAESHATSYSVAAALMCMIYALGDISGGYFNPAVTLAVMLAGRGKLTKANAAKYVLAQIVAALLAGLVVALYHMGSAISEKSIKVVPGHGHNLFQASLGEMMGTMILVYTVLTVTTIEGYMTDLGGLVVAYALAAGSFATGSISGGEVNPCVILGLVLGNLVHPGKGGASPVVSWIVLLVSEVVGALIAAAAFRVSHRQEFLPKEDKKDVKGLTQDTPADVEAQS